MSKEHPYAFSLKMLRRIIEKAPSTLPELELEKMKKRYEALQADTKVQAQEIDQTIYEFGKIIWPHRQAYEKLYQKYEQEKAKQYVLENLPQDLASKYDQFLKTKTRKSKIEKVLSPEEILAVEKAQFASLERIKKELETLIKGEKQNEFQKHFNEAQKELVLMEEKIEELKKLASEHPGLSQEILESVKFFEQAFSIAERDATALEIQKKIEYYQGRLGLL